METEREEVAVAKWMKKGGFRAKAKTFAKSRLKKKGTMRDRLAELRQKGAFKSTRGFRAA
jgi:hypothetical protein